jgi:hypothetical protein
VLACTYLIDYQTVRYSAEVDWHNALALSVSINVSDVRDNAFSC